MAKFRMNHSRESGMSSGTVVRVGLFTALIGALLYVFRMFSNDPEGIQENPTRQEMPKTPEKPADTKAIYWPASSTGALIQKQYYYLSYSEQHEQAEWVAYILTKEELDQPWVERPEEFTPDPDIPTGSALPNDYSGSGYDRGHLVPNADRSFSDAAARETFQMSNISPQARQFNQGIWRELEELTRNWAKKYKRLYIVTGPVLTQAPKGKIGRQNKVSIPAAYFKVILDLDDPEQKAIGFVLPNEVSYDPLYKYAVSVDEVEKITGIDFFEAFLPDELEEKLESSFNNDLWQYSKDKFEERINKWNNVR